MIFQHLWNQRSFHSIILLMNSRSMIGCFYHMNVIYISQAQYKFQYLENLFALNISSSHWEQWNSSNYIIQNPFSVPDLFPGNCTESVSRKPTANRNIANTYLHTTSIPPAHPLVEAGSPVVDEVFFRVFDAFPIPKPSLRSGWRYNSWIVQVHFEEFFSLFGHHVPWTPCTSTSILP